MASDRTAFTIATATRGGTYYPVGVAISTLVKARLLSDHGIDMSARNSAGSIANIAMLRSGEAQFAIVLGIVGLLAARGRGPFADAGPNGSLRSVSALWPNVEHFVVRSQHRKTGDLRDFLALKGRKVSIGQEGSGSLLSAQQIIRGLGLDPASDFQTVSLSYGDSAGALLDGRIDGAAMPGGLPVTAVTQTFAADEARASLLAITDAQIKAADAGLGLWSRRTIPVGTYPGQSEALPSMAQPNILAVRADVGEAAVYEIIKTVYNHLDFLADIHPATKAIAIETALAGLPFPLHPGAVKYFREAGLNIPKRLLPAG